jgi:ribonuclease P protein component
VGRRVGNAVVRNRVKRGVREWFRQHRCELADGSEVEAIDLVVIARVGAAELDADGIRRELEGLVR